MLRADDLYNDEWLDDAIFGSESNVESSWEGEMNLSGGLGYRDNVLLSEIAPESSGYLYTGFDAMSIRSKPEGKDNWLVLFMAENRAFFDVEDFDNETLVFALTHYSRQIESIGKLGAGVEYLYTSQAFDASIDEVETSSVVVKGSQAMFVADWKFAEQNTLKLGTGKMTFADDSNDFDLTELSFESDFSISDSLEFRLSLKVADRDYVNRFSRDDDGVLIDDSLLSLLEKRTRLTLVEQRALWRGDFVSKLYLDYSTQSSSASRYYDRDRTRLGGSLEWSGEDWSITLGASYQQIDYDVRLGEDGFTRSNDDIRWSFELERRLNKDWSVFLHFDDSEKETNESFSSYGTNSLMVGFRVPPISL